MEPEMIDNATALKAFIDGLDKDYILYVDLEGNNLSRHGTLSLITVLVEPRHTFHLVDVTTLGKEAFSVSGTNEKTLQQILESHDIIKVFYDIRNDSDALFSLFARGSKRLIKGLAKAIDQDVQLSAADSKAWKEVKDAGRKLFAPELGGSFEVFDQRPLSAEVLKYSMQDVLYMPALRKNYLDQLSPVWKAKVEEEVAGRIALSQSAAFNGKGRHMAEGPSAWQKK